MMGVMVFHSIYWVIVAFMAIHGVGVDGIQLLQVSVPSVIQAGEGASLRCDVDMENEKLYSVKWYKDDDAESVEFFRYVPRETPPVIVYNLPGISVNKSQSDWQKVYLNRVNLASSGHYRCEVSAEGPSFSSVSGGGQMEVVVLPKNRPTITGGKSNYRAGDIVDVNCTSAASKPAAKIHWWINGRKANSNYVKQYKAVSGEDGLETTVLGLTFDVQDSHLKDQGKLTLRCVASVGPSASTHNTHQNNNNNHHQNYPYQTYGGPVNFNNNKNVPPAASTASMSYGDGTITGNYPPEQQQHIGSQVMETMEVRFEASGAGRFGVQQWKHSSLLCCLLASLISVLSGSAATTYPYYRI